MRLKVSDHRYLVRLSRDLFSTNGHLYRKLVEGIDGTTHQRTRLVDGPPNGTSTDLAQGDI